MPRVLPSYGRGDTLAHRLRAAAALLTLLAGFGLAGGAAARPLQIVALGDSLTAGYGLPADAAFPVVLEAALRADGLDVRVANAGVSGDTAQAGLDRLDWSVTDGTDGVILELGANDMLRGLDPATTSRTLQTILDRLRGRGIKVLLAGMLAAPNLGPDYKARYDAIFPALAAANALPLYPFFLDGVAGGERGLRLADGMHPTAAGVALVVRRMLPAVTQWLRGFPPAG